MRDPFFHNDEHLRRLADDDAVRHAARWLFGLKLASGLVALALLAAVLVTWRLG